MNLVYFLSIGLIIATTFGEFGKYPFGSTNPSVGITDILATLTILFLLIWRIGIKKSLFLPLGYKLLLIFFGWSILGLVISGQFSGGLYLIRFIIYSSLFLVGYFLIKEDKNNLDKIFLKIVLSGIIVSLLGFIQLVILPDLSSLTWLGFDPHKNRLVSSFLDPNFVATFLNICLSVNFYLYYKFKKSKYLILGGVLLITLFLTFSRSGYLMFLIQFLGVSFLYSKKILVAGLLLIVLLFLSVPQFNERIKGAFLVDKSAIERISSWKNGYIIFRENPIFGVGFNNLKIILDSQNLLKSFENESTHSSAGVDSSFLFVLATTGILGFVLFFVFWLNLIHKLLSFKFGDLKVFQIVLILALFINSQFVNSLFYPEIMTLVYLIFGASYGYSD